MAVPATVDEFLAVVRQSNLIADDRLRALVGQLNGTKAKPRDPAGFAALLVRDGLITHFQSDQLLQGRWRGFTIGKYRVLEKIGSGGMGQVFLCEHEKMRRRVAIKVLPTTSVANDPSALKRFEREARAAATLDHPNIVKAFDLDEQAGMHYLVMEYVDGPNLHELVRKSGPLTVGRACEYVRQAALGLQHAHENGLIHRDVKPSNLLVDRQGLVKLLDLGLARFYHDQHDMLTQQYDPNHVLGTADYVAPEQTRDSHDVDVRADIYALGATLYFLLAGRPPFQEGTVAQKLIWHQTRHPTPLSTIRDDLPETLPGVLSKMMAKQPDQRFSEPKTVAALLAQYADATTAVPTEAELPSLSPAVLGNASTTPPPAAPTTPNHSRPDHPAARWADPPAMPSPPPADAPANPYQAAPRTAAAVAALPTMPPVQLRPVAAAPRSGSRRMTVVLVVLGIVAGSLGGYGLQFLLPRPGPKPPEATAPEKRP